MNGCSVYIRMRLAMLALLWVGFAGGMKAQHLGVWLDDPLDVYALAQEDHACDWYISSWPLDLDENGVFDVLFSMEHVAYAEDACSARWYHHCEPLEQWRHGRIDVETAAGLDSNTLIDNAFSYRDERMLLQSRFESSFPIIRGAWTLDSGIQYLPFKRTTDTSAQYGWLAISTNSQPGLEVYGWGISDDAGAFLRAGSLPHPSGWATPAGPLEVTQQSKFVHPGDWRLRCRLDPGPGDVAEYRVFVVRANALGAMDAPRGMNVPASRYLSFPGSTSSLDLVLPDTLKDAKGNAMVRDSLYRLCVLSVPDSISAFEPSLVMSRGIRAERRIQPVQATALTDSMDRFLPSDFHFRFETPLDTSGIDGYRVLWEKLEEDAVLPDWEADALWNASLGYPPARTMDLPPGLGVVDTFLAPSMRSTSGQALKRNQGYRIWVLSVPRSGGLRPAAQPSHTASPTWVRENSTSRIPNNVLLDDRYNHPDGRSLRWSFEPAANETGISTYRVYLERGVASGSFIPSLTNLMLRSDSQYVEVPATGSAIYQGDFEGVYDEALLPASEGNYYYAAVVAIGDSVDYFGYSRYAENPTPARFETEDCRTGKPVLTKVDSTGSTADIQVAFPLPLDTVGLSGYRVFLHQASFTPDIASLELAPDSQFLEIPLGALSDTLAGLSPLNGEPFMLNWLYSATTINIPDSVRGSVVVRSIPADAFRLEIPEWKVQNLVVEDGSDFGDGRDLDVLFEPAQDESTIAAYRIACWPVFEIKSPNDVLQAAPGRWVEVPPGATSYAVDFGSTTDLNGDPIQLDRIYKVMVLSSSLPGQASESVQGSGSISGYGMDPGPLEQFDVADFEDGRDWQIVASPAQFADSIAEYRVYAIRQPASPLNASDLLPLPSDRYQLVAPSMPFDTLLLSSKLLDHEGDSLRFGNRYRLALVSVPAPGVALAPGFSMPLGSDTYKDEQWTPERPLWSQDPISSAWLLHSEGAPNETFVQEYRALVLTSATWSIPLEDALALPDDRYVSWNPDGSEEYQINLYTGAKDVSGFGYPQPDQSYWLRVLAVVNADTGRLSPASLSIPISSGGLSGSDYEPNWSIGQSAEGLVLYHLPESPTGARIIDAVGRSIQLWDENSFAPAGETWRLDWGQPATQAATPGPNWYLLELEFPDRREAQPFVR